MKTVLTADVIVTGEKTLHDAWLVVEDARIVAVGVGRAPTSDVTHLEGLLVPGFIDLHVHGGAGGAFSDPRGIETAIAHLWSRGTTSFMASLISDEVGLLVRQIENLLPFVDNGTIAGIHLEGPFLSPVRRGAHNPAMLREPETALVSALIEALGGRRAMVTIAPELPGALDAISNFTNAGVLVALGHSEADARTAARAVDAGARSTTHLFNAMHALHHRDPGLADWALVDPRLSVELIVDGMHLAETAVQLTLLSAPQRWIAVSDAAHVTGLCDGEYMLGMEPIELVDGVARLRGTSTLAGSTTCMADEFAQLVTRFGLSPLQAVQGTATRPAALMGRTDVGRLVPGAWADLVQWHTDSVQRVMRQGQWLDNTHHGSPDSPMKAGPQDAF